MRWGGLLLSVAAACASTARPPAVAPTTQLLSPAACVAPLASACIEEGRRRSEAGAPAEAVRLYGGACARGDVRGCEWLGERLRDGHGVAADPAGAVAAFERGCELGSPTACSSLGALLVDGGPAEQARAVTLQARACYGGAGDACYQLSLLYAEGRGVGKDQARAAGLVEQGCRAGGPMACFALAQRFHDGSSGVRGSCCAVGMLLRACVHRLAQACEAAALICGEDDVVETYRRECLDRGEASFTGCEFVRGWQAPPAPPGQM